MIHCKLHPPPATSDCISLCLFVDFNCVRVCACVVFFQILNGRSWIVVDGAVLDVSTFAKRHPGGARLILNAMGTDATSEIMGEDASLGNANMTNAFSPHHHTEVIFAIVYLWWLLIL